MIQKPKLKLELKLKLEPGLVNTVPCHGSVVDSRGDVAAGIE